MSASELEQIRLGLLYKAKRNTIFAAACMLGYGAFLLYKLRDGGGMADLLPLIGLFAVILIVAVLCDESSIKAKIIYAACLFAMSLFLNDLQNRPTISKYILLAIIILILAASGLFVLFRIFKQDYSAKFRRAFKEHYLMPYFKAFGYRYEISGDIDPAKLKLSGLFFRLDRYSYGNDRVLGVYDGVKFAFCDVSLFNRFSESEILGTFFYAEFNKRISAKTLIFPVCAGAPNTGGLKKIDMDDAEFNAAFAVYSADAAGAMYILTPAFMRRLLRFAGAVAAPVSLSFADSKIYIFVNTGRDNFEPDIDESVLRRDPAALIKRELSHFLAIVKNLKLNERIWS